jgi:PilZ domain
MSSPHDRDKSCRQTTGQDATNILSSCCSYQAPAIILSLEEVQVYYHARLSSISDDSVTLRLVHALAKPPAVGAACRVSFNYRNDSRAFFAGVLEYRPKPSPEDSELVLKLRSGILGLEARMAYRVRIASGSHLAVCLVAEDGRAWNPRARDISLAGIFVDFGDQAVCPELPVGTEVDLEIRLPPDVVDLKGEVRRQAGWGYGILFSSLVTERGLLRLPALNRIVSALERQWLQERIRP